MNLYLADRRMPIGPGAQNALRAGLRLRRRRRAQYTAFAAAAIAIACAAAVSVAGVFRGQPAARGSGTVYVLSPGRNQSQGIVIPVSAATGTPGPPIVVTAGELSLPGVVSMAITPDGKTIWVADGGDAVTPISTATNTAGRPVTVVPAHQQGTAQPEVSQVLVSPDGRTVYVLDSTGTVTPISTATDRPGTPIRLGLSERLAQGQRDGLLVAMAITPDGRTLYVRLGSLLEKTYVVPIATATNTPGAPIWQSDGAFSRPDILVAPDGQTVYLVGMVLNSSHQPVYVTPISTATDRPGRTVTFATGDIPFLPVMSPDGHTIYIYVTGMIGGSPEEGLIPFSTVTDTAGPLISLGSSESQLQGVAISPDGRTVYAVTQPLPDPGTTPLPGFADSNYSPASATSPASGGGFKCPGGKGIVTPISTATNTARASINVGCLANVMAVSPDGTTVWVAVPGAVIPISTATGQRGQPIPIGEFYPTAILVAP